MRLFIALSLIAIVCGTDILAPARRGTPGIPCDQLSGCEKCVASHFCSFSTTDSKCYETREVKDPADQNRLKLQHWCAKPKTNTTVTVPKPQPAPATAPACENDCIEKKSHDVIEADVKVADALPGSEPRLVVEADEGEGIIEANQENLKLPNGTVTNFTKNIEFVGQGGFINTPSTNWTTPSGDEPRMIVPHMIEPAAEPRV